MTLHGAIGANKGGVYCSGKLSIPGTESTAATSYAFLPSHDVIPSVVMPTDGLICVAYRALFSKDAGNAFGMIHLNNVQLTMAAPGSPVGEAVEGTGFAVAGAVNTGLVYSSPFGLRASSNTSTSATLVTSGMTLATSQGWGGSGNGLLPGGGVCYIEAAAGSYDVSVQYRVSSGTISVGSRVLRVWTMDFT